MIYTIARASVKLIRDAANGMRFDGIVMPAHVAGIDVFQSRQNKDVDGRNKSGHDERVVLSKRIMRCLAR